MASSAITFARTAYRGLYGLSQAAALIAPLPLSPYSRAWAVWGRDLRKFALVDPGRAFLYASVPKAANTTVRRLLWRRLGVEVSGPASQRTLHLGGGPYLTLPDLAQSERTRILTAPEVFRFSFVRNPYDRLRSAYLQKLVSPNRHETAAHYLTALGWDDQVIPSFGQFVRRVVSQSDERMNIHWKPQHRCLVLDAVPYAFIGQVERFDEDIKHVLERIGADPGDYQPSMSLNRTGADAESRAHYDETLADLVFERYRRDFEAFGYGRDSYLGD